MSELKERPPRPNDMSPSYSLFAERAWAYMLHIEAENAQLRTERDEWKARCLTSEASEEDAQQAAARFKAERDSLLERVEQLSELAEYGYAEMSAEIAQLSTERDRYKVALEDIKEYTSSPSFHMGKWVYERAHAALTQREGGEG